MSRHNFVLAAVVEIEYFPQVSLFQQAFVQAIASSHDDAALEADLCAFLLSVIPIPSLELETSCINESDMSADATMPYTGTPAKQLRQATEAHQSSNQRQSWELEHSEHLLRGGDRQFMRTKDGDVDIDAHDNGRSEAFTSAYSSTDSLTLYLSPASLLPSARTPPMQGHHRWCVRVSFIFLPYFFCSITHALKIACQILFVRPIALIRDDQEPVSTLLMWQTYTSPFHSFSTSHMPIIAFSRDTCSILSNLSANEFSLNFGECIQCS